MHNQVAEFYIKTKDKVVAQVGHAVTAQPAIQFNNKGITWFNDNKTNREDRKTMKAATLEDSRRKLDIEDLVNEINFLKWEKGIETLKITQVSPKTGTKVFTVNNLEAELINEELMGDAVICTDDEEAIIENCSPLMMFQQKFVLSIYKTRSLNRTSLFISFSDGVEVEIEQV